MSVGLCRHSLATNGKSICEGRAKLDGKFNFDQPKQIAFSDYQITKKSNMKSKLRLNASGFSIIYSTPPFANTMLSAVILFFSNLYHKVSSIFPLLLFEKLLLVFLIYPKQLHKSIFHLCHQTNYCRCYLLSKSL